MTQLEPVFSPDEEPVAFVPHVIARWRGEPKTPSDR